MITQPQLNLRQTRLVRGIIAALVIMLLITLVFGAGSIRVVKSDSTTTYSASVLGPITSGILGMIAFVGGIVYWRQPVHLFRAVGVVLVGMGAFCMFNAPTGLTHHVTVTPDGFSHRIGTWYSPVEASVDFDSTLFLAVKEAKPQSGQRERYYDLVCMQKLENGEIRVPLHDLMKKALPEIFSRARSRNVLVVDNRDEHQTPSNP